MKLCIIFSIVVLILTACQPSATTPTISTPTPTPAPSTIPTSTLTPTPVPVMGTLFFDMNGSGLQDDATFIYNASRLTDDKQPLHPDLLKSIHGYIEDHPELKDGDLITIKEPGLSGFSLCINNNCTVSDEIGSFVINESISDLKWIIVDPNQGIPILEMRFLNQWIASVVIPAYVINEVQIPEQHLNVTQILPVDQGIMLSDLETYEIGLMQGFLTLPYSLADASNYWISNYVDLNPDEGVLLYNGMTDDFWSRPQGEKERGGDGNNHNGIDFEGPENTFILSAFAGTIDLDATTSIPIQLLGNMESLPYEISNGHHNGLLVDKLSTVYRGQIIGLNGSSANGQHPHNHFSVYSLRNDDDKSIGPSNIRIDPFGNLLKDETRVISYLSGEQESVQFSPYSLWSVYNYPIFP